MQARRTRERISRAAGGLARLTVGSLSFVLATATAHATTMPCAKMTGASSAVLRIESAASVIGSLPEGAEVKGRGSHAGKISPYLVNLPQFCRVNAILSPVKGSRIEIELWLPKDWNGKLVGLGSHGFGGNFERGDMGMVMRRGYAVVTSDLGHSSRVSERQADFNVGDARFAINNPVAVDDFAWRATHVMTLAAKDLVKRFYGTRARRAYFDGCSNGGRQAMREAQQFPRDYDGIVAGSAASYWTRSFFATARYLQAGMLPSGHKIAQTKLDLAQRAAVAACDRIDGATDNLIVDPKKCGWKASALLCQPGQDQGGCLTAEEAEAIDTVHRPITDPRTGTVLYPGLYPGSEGEWRNMIAFNAVTANYFRYMVMNDANWAPKTDSDLFAVLARSEQSGAPGLRINSTNPDLSSFRKAGGKLIQYHGWADPSFGPADATGYYDEVIDVQPDADKVAATQSFYRLFMVPAMNHCYGGNGPVHFGGLDHEPTGQVDADHDVLDALDRWVEKGRAPGRIVATQFTAEGKVRRQMPLCPYPAVAAYVGGDVDRPESFACKRGAQAAIR